MAIRRYRRRAPVRRRRVYSRRRSMRPSVKRTRFRRRRTRKMKGKWSRPDRFRSVAPYDMINTAIGDLTTAHSPALSNKSVYSSWCINPSYISEALGAHGKYDSQLIALPGVAIGSAARTYDYERNNRGFSYMLRRPKWTFRITPDWREQGTPDSETTYAANAGMVVEAFLLTTKRNYFKADALFADDGTGLILNSLAFTPTNTTSTPSVSGTGFDGWPRAYANGVERRIGYITGWESATVLRTFESSSLRQRSTVSELCSDGISMVDSPELHQKYRVRRIGRKFISPGTSATIKCTMPSQFYDTRRLDQVLPLGNPDSNSWTGYYPKNYGSVVLRFQMLSNRVDATSHPPVSFKSEVALTAQLLVKDSNYGGNLYLDLKHLGTAVGDPPVFPIVANGPMDGKFLQPSNPLRVGGSKP